MELEEKEELLRRFSEYLDNAGEEDIPPAPDDTFGLHSELAGLKNEVHIESRQLKQALDDFRAVIVSLEAANKQLDQQLDDARQRENTVADNAVKPLLGSLIDLIDRFTEAVAVRPPRKTFFSFGYQQRLQQWIMAQQEGLVMLSERLADITARHGLERMSCAGEPFSVNSMEAVGTDYDATQPEGIVLSEARTGFLLRGEPLRHAEVIVNRKKPVNDE